MRQQIKPTHRIHGIIEGKDWAPNSKSTTSPALKSDADRRAQVIPDYAKMRWLVRAPTSDEVEVLRDRLLNCIKCVWESP